MKNGIQHLIAWFTERLQIRGSSRLVWTFRNFFFPPTPIVTIWGGARLHIDREVRSNTLYPFHLHSFDVILVARTFLREGAVFLDVGANIGYLSVIGAGLVGARGRVLSVEPQPRILETLRENVALNDLGQTTIFANAISVNPGRAMFSVATDPGLSRLTVAKCAAMEELDQVEVETIPLDEVVARAGVSTVDFVKMDIEGYELEALKSAPRLLREIRPAWILEVNRYSLEAVGGSAEALRGMFVAAEYEIYGIDSHHDNWFRASRKPSLHPVTHLPGFGDFLDILCVPSEKVEAWRTAHGPEFGLGSRGQG